MEIREKDHAWHDAWIASNSNLTFWAWLIDRAEAAEAERDELARQLEREQEIRDTVVEAAANLARANEKLAAELLALKVKV
jgi:hypothetical protein